MISAKAKDRKKPGKGHNSGPVQADRLKSFVERIEKLKKEKAAINSDIKDAFDEAVGVGYDAPAMRKVIKLRAMDSADRAEQGALLDTYAHALGLETGAQIITLQPSEDEIDSRAEKLAAEVDRCMALTNDATPPKIAAIVQEFDCSAGKASKLRKLVEARLAAGISFSPDTKSSSINENETAGGA